MPEDAPTVVLHRYAGSTGCVNVVVCGTCIEAGIMERGDEPDEPGDHTPCQRCALCALDEMAIICGEAVPYACPCPEVEEDCD